MKFKQFLKYNRPAAVVGLILLILLTVFIDTNLTLLIKRTQVRKACFDPKEGPAVSALVQKCADEARFICEISAGAGIDAQKALDAWTDAAAAAKSPFGCRNAVENLYYETAMLYTRLESSGISEETKKTAGQYYSKMGKLLSDFSKCEGYNKKAEKYNAAADALISRLIAPWFRPTTEIDGLEERFKEMYDILGSSESPAGTLSSLIHGILEKLGEIIGEGKEDDTDEHSPIHIVNGSKKKDTFKTILTIVIVIVALRVIGGAGGSHKSSGGRKHN